MRLRRGLQQVIRNPLEVIFIASPSPSRDLRSLLLTANTLRLVPLFFGSCSHFNATSSPAATGHKESTKLRLVPLMTSYIIPPMPPMPPAGIAGASSLILATTDSVVSNVEATLVAFWSALLVTFAGSRIPA